MRVAISGKSGCGNTTVSTLVADRMNYPIINFTFRSLAEEKGLDFWQLCKMAETDDEIDKELDKKQVEKALAVEDCVLGSRLAIWMLVQADLKVYLTASIEERAMRIQKREGGTFADRLKETVERDEKDTARYKRIYSIDNSDSSIADLVIDTDKLEPIEIAHIIVKRIHELLAQRK
ncbi:MAG: cytidylate kinase [Spirochaetia bacterium]|nr:cytidylate kinase [Spirochaetia bacterium]